MFKFCLAYIGMCRCLVVGYYTKENIIHFEVGKWKSTWITSGILGLVIIENEEASSILTLKYSYYF